MADGHSSPVSRSSSCSTPSVVYAVEGSVGRMVCVREVAAAVSCSHQWRSFPRAQHHFGTGSCWGCSRHQSPASGAERQDRREEREGEEHLGTGPSWPAMIGGCSTALAERAVSAWREGKGGACVQAAARGHGVAGLAEASTPGRAEAARLSVSSNSWSCKLALSGSEVITRHTKGRYSVRSTHQAQTRGRAPAAFLQRRVQAHAGQHTLGQPAGALYRESVAGPVVVSYRGRCSPAGSEQHDSCSTYVIDEWLGDVEAPGAKVAHSAALETRCAVGVDTGVALRCLSQKQQVEVPCVRLVFRGRELSSAYSADKVLLCAPRGRPRCRSREYVPPRRGARAGARSWWCALRCG